MAISTYERVKGGRVGVESKSGVDLMDGLAWEVKRTISSRRSSM